MRKIIFILLALHSFSAVGLLSFNCLALEDDLMPGFDGLIENRSQNAQPENNDRIIIRRGKEITREVKRTATNIMNQMIIKLVAAGFALNAGRNLLQKKPTSKAGFILFLSSICFIFSHQLADKLRYDSWRKGTAVVAIMLFYKDILKTIFSEKTFDFYYDKIIKWGK